MPLIDADDATAFVASNIIARRRYYEYVTTAEHAASHATRIRHEAAQAGMLARLICADYAAA